MAPLDCRYTTHAEQQLQPGSRRTCNDKPANAPPESAVAEGAEEVSPSLLEQPVNTTANPTTPAPNAVQKCRRPMKVISRAT
jgi:hypothetical protein